MSWWVSFMILVIVSVYFTYTLCACCVYTRKNLPSSLCIPSIIFDCEWRIDQKIGFIPFSLCPSIFAFSKRKLCNSENFRIKDFDEFRCFWGSWVRIIGFLKMYVCMYVYMYVCMYVCRYIFIYVYMYVCMYVCIYLYMYICMYVCMYETKFCPGHNSWMDGRN